MARAGPDKRMGQRVRKAACGGQCLMARPILIGEFGRVHELDRKPRSGIGWTAPSLVSLNASL